jgi:hypothetical protein
LAKLGPEPEEETPRRISPAGLRAYSRSLSTRLPLFRGVGASQLQLPHTPARSQNQEPHSIPELYSVSTRKEKEKKKNGKKTPTPGGKKKKSFFYSFDFPFAIAWLWLSKYADREQSPTAVE